MSYYRVGDHGVIFGNPPRRVAFAPALTPVSLSSSVIVTGHSIPDGVYPYPWAGVIEDAGFTPVVRSGTGPFATAQFRWNNDPAGPDQVKALLEAPGAAYDLFLGTEAHGGGYTGPGTRNSVAAHIEFSDAYGYALLWHNLAAAAGAQTFYSNFWRNDPTEAFDAAWRAELDLEVPLWDGIIDHVNANRAGGTPAMRLIPWLQVFMAVYDAIQAGTVTGITMPNLFSDDVHCTNLGIWIQMATLMAVMYQRHPDELSNTVSLEFGATFSIDAGLAAQLRPVVWAACLATPRSGLGA